MPKSSSLSAACLGPTWFHWYRISAIILFNQSRNSDMTNYLITKKKHTHLPKVYFIVWSYLSYTKLLRRAKTEFFRIFFWLHIGVCVYTHRTHDILYDDDNGLELFQFRYSFSFPPPYVTFNAYCSLFVDFSIRRNVFIKYNETKHIFTQTQIDRNGFIKEPPHI